MKKLLAAALLAVAVVAAFTGCKKDKIFAGIQVELPAAEFPLDTFILNRIPLDVPVQLPDIPQNFNLNDSIKAHTNGDFGANDVKSVLIENIRISLKNPNATTQLSNFTRATFYIASNANPSDSLLLGTIGFDGAYDSKEYVPNPSPQLRPYLNGTQLIYKIIAVLHERPSQTMHLAIHATMRAK